METKQKKGMQARWISVEEALPPMNEEVIVLRNDKRLNWARIAFGHIVDLRFCRDYEGWNIPGVTHWMPCPPIPEGVELDEFIYEMENNKN